MAKLIILIVLSIFTARVLERRYKVAAIAHSVLFIFTLVFFCFTTDLPLIVKAMNNIIPKMYYDALKDALLTPAKVLNFGLSGILVLDCILYLFVPILSIIALIKEAREQFKEMKIKANVKVMVGYVINLVLDPIKDFKHNKNETYLILGKLLN